MYHYDKESCNIVHNSQMSKILFHYIERISVYKFFQGKFKLSAFKQQFSPSTTTTVVLLFLVPEQGRGLVVWRAKLHGLEVQNVKIK